MRKRKSEIPLSPAVIPGRASARTRNLEIPGSMLRIAPGMTGSNDHLHGFESLDVELAHRAGNHEIVVVEHQRTGDAVLEQLE